VSAGGHGIVRRGLVAAAGAMQAARRMINARAQGYGGHECPRFRFAAFRRWEGA
jgi:hypothetical protein